jgi:hypothetical protein
MKYLWAVSWIKKEWIPSFQKPSLLSSSWIDMVSSAIVGCIYKHVCSSGLTVLVQKQSWSASGQQGTSGWSLVSAPVDHSQCSLPGEKNFHITIFLYLDFSFIPWVVHRFLYCVGPCLWHSTGINNDWMLCLCWNCREQPDLNDLFH